MSHARTPSRPALRGSAGLVAAATAALIGLPLISPALADAPDASSVLSSAASSNPLDELGRPNHDAQERIRAFADQPWLPPAVRDAILSALAFSLGQSGESGVPLPENVGPFRQFYWPTVSARCIGGQGDSIGSAIAVPGPATIPAPGAGEGETVFLFTALGTPPAAAEQGGMKVQWFNLATFQGGETQLFNNGINADGPTTVSGRAATGKGLIVAWLSGTVNTAEGACSFAPTAAILEVN